jgi:Fe-S-cluster-containing hydrogenase component 2
VAQVPDAPKDESILDTAVVCDMCDGRSGPRTACVNACPHDAAMRLEARAFFSPD